jgi:hypothetical protein
MNRALLLLPLALLVQTTTARADDAADTATARALGIEGVTLAEGGKCGEAIPKLDRAEKLHHAPTTATRLAECEIEIGKLVVGTERLQRVIREPLPPGAHPAFAAAVARAQKALDVTLPRLATLRLSVNTPPSAKVSITIDDEPVSDAVLDTARRIDPGKHVVKVQAPGYFPTSASPTLAEGETKSIALELRPDPNARIVADASVPSTAATTTTPRQEGGSKLPALFAFGIGAAGLGLGIYAATVVEEKSSALDRGCTPDRVCPKALGADLDDAKTWANISTAGFITAGAGAATGVLLLILSGSSSEPERKSARVRPSVGPTSVSLQGTF